MHPSFGQRGGHGHHRYPTHHHPYAEPHHPVPARGRAGKLLALAAVLFLSTWAGTATLYILFRDDALRVIASRQVELNRVYDSQVVSLRAEIERLKSVKFIEQERVDRAVAELSRRQTVLESRQSSLNSLAASKPGVFARDPSPEITGSILPSGPSTVPAPAHSGKPSPLSDTILLSPPSDKRARLESRPVPPMGGRLNDGLETAHEVRLANLENALGNIEAEQGRALNAAEESVDAAERRIRSVFADLGVKPPRKEGWFEASIGGPFLPFSRPPEDPFARQIHRVRAAADSIDYLSQSLATLPVRKPLASRTDVTSPFGMRVDPFVRQMALHTGVDFKGEPGDLVRAAAGGKVTEAGRNGGYGLMVEIDHGNGLVTRYAHLSAIDVSEGTVLKPGDMVGRVGSTGRSTGPHLHFEVRLNGDPVDPQKYLRAGLRLFEPL